MPKVHKTWVLSPGSPELPNQYQPRPTTTTGYVTGAGHCRPTHPLAPQALLPGSCGWRQSACDSTLKAEAVTMRPISSGSGSKGKEKGYKCIDLSMYISTTLDRDEPVRDDAAWEYAARLQAA